MTGTASGKAVCGTWSILPDFYEFSPPLQEQL